MMTRALETVLSLADILVLGGTSCSAGGCTRSSTTGGDAEQIHTADWLKILWGLDDSKGFQNAVWLDLIYTFMCGEY